MKIAIVNNGLAGGGIERASTSLANYWCQQSHEVSLIALYKSEHFFSLEVGIAFNEPLFPYAGSKFLYNLRIMLWLRKQIILAKPDVVLAFGESTNAYVQLALKGTEIPVFVSDRMHPKARLPRLTFFLKRKLYPKAAGIILQTQFAKAIMSSYLLGGNINVIPNPVNLIVPLVIEKRKVIVSVGRLEEVKGHEYLIRAFASIDAPEWRLSLVGDGSLMDRLKNLAAQLGVAERVVFHGHLKDFRKELSEASIFVLPSLKEGFPNALLEAMSVPLACIATDFMGVENELIKDGQNGLICSVADADAIKKKMQFLIDNPDRITSLATMAKKVREQYAFPKIADEYMKVFKAHVK
ncbi:MAG: GalNAc-alpha-(1-_4)-GalNAc-alpha-(1-_3)-diNAcBac-PP-undecaprenol alpha-1,4-N-acetyl-D-galactosaminyltransferase [Sediminicola sp.]